MIVIKKLHDKLDQVDKVPLKLVKFVNLVMQIFIIPFCGIFAARSLSYPDIGLLIKPKINVNF